MNQMLLLERVHLTFEVWFIRQFLQDLLPKGNFCIIDLRQDYLRLCWKEEELWQKWKQSACNCFSYPKVLSASCPTHQDEIFERSENATQSSP